MRLTRLACPYCGHTILGPTLAGAAAAVLITTGFFVLTLFGLI